MGLYYWYNKEGDALKMDMVHKAVLAGVCTAGGIVIKALGGWDGALQLLAACMAADYATGLVVAGVFKKSGKTAGGGLESHAGFAGLLRKGAILLVVFLGTLLDSLPGGGFVRPAVCCFFISNEGLSVLENLGLMGVPYPAFLRDMLEALRKKGGDGPESPAGKED